MKKAGPIAEKQADSMSLRQKVYAQIKHDIITCKLEPGDPLSEGQFVAQFEVSKTPIREALTSLVQDRLVEYIPNRGFMVASISLHDVQEIFEARGFYEVALYKLAIQRITDADIDLLEGHSKVEFDSNDPEAVDFVLKSNLNFHLGIARVSGNSRLYWHYASLMDEAQRLIYLDFKNSSILPVWHHSHHGIMEALRCHDEASGVQAIEETLEQSKRRILRAD